MDTKAKHNVKTKDFVLEQLEKSKGRFITGMDLAKELGVSRNAIWKAINELKSEGYVIHSVNNKGYSLNPESDIISSSAIRSLLSDDKKDIVDKMSVYDELPSTNQTAKMELISSITNKNIIIARRQTSGTGHNNSTFSSPEGGIYISIVVKPENLIPDTNKKTASLNNKKIGEAVKSVIDEFTHTDSVLDKKMNRITIKNKVICGILTEYFADMETSDITGYVIGIGIKNIHIPKNECIAKILSKLSEFIILT